MRNQTSLVAVAAELASRREQTETAPWSLEVLRYVTTTLATGAPVEQVASDTGWSSRTLQRQCQAVYGYGPATLRRILRFRRATVMLQAGRSPSDVAAAAGYADQPHLNREVRAFAGTTGMTGRGEPFVHGVHGCRHVQLEGDRHPAGTGRRHPPRVHSGDHLFGVECQPVAARQGDLDVGAVRIGNLQSEQTVEPDRPGHVTSDDLDDGGSQPRTAASK